MKPKIVHLVDVLEKGGAQKIVFDVVSSLSSEFDFEVWAFFGGAYENELKKRGIEVKILGLRPEKIGLRYPVNIWRTIRWLKKNFRKTGPQILQTHLLGSDIWGRFAAPNIKIIQTIHSAEKFRGKIFSRFGLKMLFFDRISAKKTDLIIAVSQAAKKSLIKEGIDPKKIRVVYPGVELQKFVFSEKEREKWRRLWRAKSKVVIGSVGRLDKVKRYDLLLYAFSRLTKAILVLVGDGPERESLKKLASQLNIKDKVIFMGQRPDVEKLLSGFDIFVLPSKWEGFPLVIIEAAANGRPILASNVGGIPEFIRNGKNGWLFNGSSPELLAKKLNSLVESRSLREKLGRQAALSAQEFSLARMIEKYRQIYQSLL